MKTLTNVTIYTFLMPIAFAAPAGEGQGDRRVGAPPIASPPGTR
jgi:hypothetical protein